MDNIEWDIIPSDPDVVMAVVKKHPAKKAPAKKAPAKKKASAKPLQSPQVYKISSLPSSEKAWMASSVSTNALKHSLSSIETKMAEWNNHMNKWSSVDPDQTLPELPTFCQLGTSFSSAVWFRRMLAISKGLQVHFIDHNGKVFEDAYIVKVDTMTTHSSPEATQMWFNYQGEEYSILASEIRGFFIL